MSFDTFYRFSVHAAIFNADNDVLVLRQTYGDKRWGLPGGGVEPGETLIDAIIRECKEELGVTVFDPVLTGFYYHSEYNSQVGIFRCKISDTKDIFLSSEHSEYKFMRIQDLSKVQQLRVYNALMNRECISFCAF